MRRPVARRIWTTAVASAIGCICVAVLPQVAGAAFAGRNGLIAIAPVTGDGVVLIDPANGAISHICGPRSDCASRVARPRWSPDGRTLVLDGPNTIVYPDGSCLDCFGFGGSSASFTNESDALTTLSGTELEVVGTDGIGHAQVPIDHRVTGEAWSSTGELAVVDAGRVDAGVFGRLHAVGIGSEPDWSPSGRSLVFVQRGWVVSATIGRRGVRRLVRGTDPVLSPNGRQLAFVDPKGVLAIVTFADHRVRAFAKVPARSLDWQALPASASTSCEPPIDSEVVASDAVATLTSDGGGSPGSLTGCVTSTGRERTLLDAPGYNPDATLGFGPLALAGTVAAVGASSVDAHYNGPGTAGVIVYDLTTGDPLRGLGGESIEGAIEANVNTVVVDAQGFSAAVLDAQADDATFQYALEVSDSHGVRTLATVSQRFGDPPWFTDLTLTGDTLTWLQNGTPESAQLS